MSQQTNDILNRLVVLHMRSLPMYLHFARPWQVQKHPQAAQTLQNIVYLQQEMADRMAKLLLENGVSVDFGEFPMAFTSLHDLSVEFLLKTCIDRQQKEIAVIEQAISLLNTAPYAQAVAQEALGEAKGNLESLQAAAKSEPLEPSIQ